MLQVVGQETHSLRGERVEGFLVGQLTNEPECSTDVLGRKIVFPLNFLEGHPTREAPHHERNRHPGAANNGFAVADGGIKRDAVMAIHEASLRHDEVVSKADFDQIAREDRG